MLRWWYRLIPKRSLDGVIGPTRVRVRGAIADGELAESPVTGRRAAVIVWFFSYRFTSYGGVHQRSSTVLDRDDHRLQTWGRYVGPWIRVDVGGRLVRIDTTSVGVAVASSDYDGQILNALPDALAKVRVDLTDPNLRYGERWLAPGDTVILDAEVRPVAPAPLAAPYRGDLRERAPQADFEAVGRALVEDTIGTDLRIG